MQCLTASAQSMTTAKFGQVLPLPSLWLSGSFDSVINVDPQCGRNLANLETVWPISKSCI